MTKFQSVTLFALLVCGCSMNIRESESYQVNPIRRVVTMMQDMQNKVTAEGKRDQELFDAYMCYCKNGVGELKGSIGAAETKIPQVTSSLEEAIATKQQVVAEIAQHKQDRSDAQSAVAKATALREKEAAAFAKFSADSEANILALGKAIAAILKGAAGGFLQTAAANVVRQITVDVDMSSTDRDVISSFLSQGQTEGYVPQSGQIVGILKQLQDTMKAELKDAIAEEESAKSSFSAMTAAKKKEINANTRAIEAKLQRDGELGVQIAEMKEDLDDTSVALAEDRAFLADLDKGCGTREAEYEVVKRTRAEELLALADTIKILNDDDALDLFKKRLPTPALLQTVVSGRAVRQHALRILSSARGKKLHGDAGLGFIALALRGQKVSFTKVITMVDQMLVLLQKEQEDDDDKKAYCEFEIDKAEDELKSLEQTVSDLSKAMDKAAGQLETLTAEIAALTKGINDLDKQVADATANRKAERAEYKQSMTEDNAAKELLALAKNRLNKFYNPKMYKAPAKRELTAEERVVYNNGGTLAPTDAPGGIAGTGVTAFVQVSSVVAPPPPPEAVGAYQKRGQENSGVLTMIDMLVGDLDKEIQELTVEENDSQAEYEQFIKDSAAKRAADSKSLAEKEDAKADTEAALNKMSKEHKTTLKRSMAKDLFISDLHKECDWLLANFETRKEARAGEVESLKNAKAVLSGADYA